MGDFFFLVVIILRRGSCQFNRDVNEVTLCKMSNSGSTRNGGLVSVVPLRL